MKRNKLLDLYNSKLRFFVRREKSVIFAYAFLVIFFVVASCIESNFSSPINIKNLIKTATPLLIAGLAQSLALLIGGIDLSIGSIMSITNTICATMMTDEPGGWIVPVLISVAVGLVAGFLNGVLITKGKLQSIILTTATAIAFGGVALLIMDAPGGKTSKPFYDFVIKGAGDTMPLILSILLVALLTILIKKTVYGRNVYAVGGNMQSAISSGIKVDKINILTFTIIGLLAAIGGISLNATISSGDPLSGVNFTQRSIVAAALGGTSMAGGKGGFIGCIAGAFILTIINNILNLIGITSWYQHIVLGVLLVIAVIISNMKGNKEA